MGNIYIIYAYVYEKGRSLSYKDIRISSLSNAVIPEIIWVSDNLEITKNVFLHSLKFIYHLCTRYWRGIEDTKKYRPYLHELVTYNRVSRPED